ncbi:aminotransferase class I/II-fold pyridoxal phosphate-dependent enzyme [Paenibacillus sanguinis]|uniref:aminotransferase class I/II-fold pyridoxal phosphate-dependent enzyme n=1 Tax=Paenibacillus sanguinis TaxID=225906 RepID=UPI00036E8A6A|nr:aminotransferase class I/II-fold pyridoxal phosphate-dependent enzyme [Paenibacillus sanguinis]
MFKETYNAPLLEVLREYRKRQDTSFHVPGHKDGQAWQAYSGDEKELAQVMGIDATEITGTDDLHHPQGVIQEAQRLAAIQFGAEETCFLVGGSTAGNLALILSVCTTPGDVLLVQRNVHKSVIHGLMLAGAHAVFLAPQQDPGSGLSTLPSTAVVGEALRRYPGAKGVLVTHPNYYGMGAPLRPLADICHAHGVPLLVDEAHGAHFGQHPALPESALAAGADGVVQSTHKMLTALTMGAMLHVQGGLLDRTLLKQRLAMLQSSSPSYPIMASLDWSRSLLQAHGPDLLEEGLAAAAEIRQGLKQLSRFAVVEPPGASGESTAYTIQDPWKLVIYDAAGRLNGYELQERLEAEGCVPEMSDDRYVVLALGPGTTSQHAVHLLTALQRIAEVELKSGRKADKSALSANFSEPVQVSDVFSRQISTWNNVEDGVQPPLRDVWQGEGLQFAISESVAFNLTPVLPKEIESVPVEHSAGRRAAEMVIPYPPGIPLLYPGEKITEILAERLVGLRNSGAKCQGAADSQLLTIQVLKL